MRKIFKLALIATSLCFLFVIGNSNVHAQIKDQSNTLTCYNGQEGINTAIGCVPFGNNSGIGSLMGFILAWAIGLASGVAFLLILYGGFQIMTSSGDPQRLKAGQELLTAAISGLLMLIFSVFILRVIGVNILGIFS